MPGLLDDELMDVPCEACGRDVKVRMDKLRTSPTVTCACGQQIKVDASQLDGEMRKVDDALKGLDDATGDMNMTIKI